MEKNGALSVSILDKHIPKEHGLIALNPIVGSLDHIGKSFLEALILASNNPQYDKRLFIGLPVQYMKITSSEHVVYINCSLFQNKNKTKQIV